MDTTTIEISVENWQWLNSQKRPGESFNDVLDRLRGDGEAAAPPADEDDDLDGDDDRLPSVEMPDDLDLPGSGDTYERRREAIGRLYAYLQREGTGTRAEFLELVDPDEVDYASGASFWSNCVKGRDSLSALEGVHPPSSEGEHTWRYEAD